MATAPPTIVINTPGASTPTISAPRQAPDLAKPKTPSIDTSPAPRKPLFSRPHSALTTPEDKAACYLCDEQNPGDFSPTTKYLDTCLLCSRYFCPIHKHTSFEQVCNINHSTYYHEMLNQAREIVVKQNGPQKGLEGRELAEVLIAEGIYPSLGEREKAIFTTSPVDEQKRRELESFRSLEAAVVNGGERGKRGEVEERELVGADVAV